MDLSFLIVESKKERLIDKYKTANSSEIWIPSITRIIDEDPSKTKKYSEWMIKQLINVLPLSTPNVDIVISLVKEFDNDSKKINDDVIKIYEETIKGLLNLTFGRDMLGTVQDIDRVKNHPKDINSYLTYKMADVMLDSIEEYVEGREIKKDEKKNIIKHYEDENYLIVQPLTYKASCYYGANTRWCTASKSSSANFDSYSKTGTLYYIINKKSPSSTTGKMALYVRKEGNASVYDQKDTSQSFNFLLSVFEPISDVIRKISGKLRQYDILIKVRNNETPTTYPIYADNEDIYMDFSDDGTKVYFDFRGNDDTVLDLVSGALEDYQEAAVRSAINGNYYDTEYYDSYNFDDDIKQGYPLRYLNNDHLEMLNDILSLLNNDLTKCIVRGDTGLYIEYDCEGKMGEYLLGFSDFIDDFREIYSYAQNQAMEAGVGGAVREELCDAMDGVGLVRTKTKIDDKVVSSECFTTYEIPVDTLIGYYNLNLDNLGDKTIDELLKIVIDDTLSLYIEPHEMAYENFDEDVFHDEFDYGMTRILDNFYDNILYSDEYVDVEEAAKIHKYITKKYGFGNKIPIKTTEDNISLIFDKVDLKTNKIDFTLINNDTHQRKQGRAKLSTIESLMNNYQLFSPFD